MQKRINMKSLITITLVTLIGFSSCKKTNNLNAAESPSKTYFIDYDDKEKLNKLKHRVKKDGDTIAYLELKAIYRNTNRYDEFLYYALLMSNDYNYSQAHFDTYLILRNIDDSTFSKKSKLVANFYLLLAHENNVKDAKYVMNDRFGKKSNFPKSEKYWIKINAKRLKK
jgi:hypothetical protein